MNLEMYQVRILNWDVLLDGHRRDALTRSSAVCLKMHGCIAFHQTSIHQETHPSCPGQFVHHGLVVKPAASH